MSTKNSPETEIKSWLTVVLKNQHLADFTVEILGNSEKGDGYMGDIVFVTVREAPVTESSRVYNLVLKCSKRSQALRDTSPVKEAFRNEIVLYEKILPCYSNFQKEKGIVEPFDSFPKYYGSFIGPNMEVLVLENLKSVGYELWPKKQPLTRKHIDLVMSKYAKLHSTSVALQLQKPEVHQQLRNEIAYIFRQLVYSADMNTFMGGPIDDSCNLLKGEVEDSILEQWKNFKSKIYFTLDHMLNGEKYLKAILHGDCWNNNFMHKHSQIGGVVPEKVAFLDWQVPKFDSPVLDLSFFLFSCLSKDDLEKLDEILGNYHNIFISHLKDLGTENADSVYPFEEFMEDWKRMCKFGILMTSLVLKIASTNQDEVLDLAELAENGKDFTHAFSNQIRDKDNYKNRMRPIIEFVVKNNLI